MDMNIFKVLGMKFCITLQEVRTNLQHFLVVYEYEFHNFTSIKDSH